MLVRLSAHFYTVCTLRKSPKIYGRKTPGGRSSTKTNGHIRAYEIPSDLFQIPTGFVWIFTARLVTGKGLPTMASEWAIGAAVLFAISTLVRIHTVNSRWHAYIPGGIAVAIGMLSLQPCIG